MTEGKRYQISALLEQGVSIKNIALAIDCHRSSVYRELSRNSGKVNNCPQTTHQACIERKSQALKYKIPSERVEFIRLLIEHDWSPEQVLEVLPASRILVSHEWIYQFIASDKAMGGEIDTVLGKHGTGAIVTLFERKSRFLLIKKVNSKLAKDVTAATIELLKPYKVHEHTITADNGREFANHEEIAEALEAEVYFAHPYSSWERGANENADGLLRQYVPKGSDLREVTEGVISLAIARINYRPKKCLGSKQPAVIFKEMCMAA